MKPKTRCVQIDLATHLKLKQASVSGTTIGALIRELVDRFLVKLK